MKYLSSFSNFKMIKDSKQDFFNLLDANNITDVDNNINYILGQYADRKMAAIEVELYLMELKDLGKEYIQNKNISSRDELKDFLLNKQIKARKGKGKERKENKINYTVDKIEQIALAQHLDMENKLKDKK